MKRSFLPYALILTLLSLAVTFAGCGPIASRSQQVTGSGKLVTQEYDLSGFDTINAGSNFKLNVRPGHKFAVSVTADDNVMPILNVGKSGSELRLNVKPGSYGFNNVTMKADITLPELKEVTLDGNAVAHLDPFTAPSLAFHLKSNGMADGSVTAGKLLVEGGGNAQARLSGTADILTVKGAGNAIFNLGGLSAKDALVDINSNAMATVNATEKLDYSAVGNAGLTYTGGAKLGEQKTGGNASARSK
jgi:hypothetical protein